MPLYFNSLPFMPWYTCYAFRAILRRGIRYNWFQRPVVDHWGLRRHALVNLWRTGGETLVNKPGMVRNISCILIYVPKVIGEVVKTSNFPDFFIQLFYFFFNAAFTNTYVTCINTPVFKYIHGWKFMLIVLGNSMGAIFFI